MIASSGRPFRDRAEAGRLRARELAAYRGRETVVLGIPRRGLVVAAEIALGLEAEMDVVLARKIGFPENPQVALGAITESGQVFFREPMLSVDRAYIEEEKASSTIVSTKSGTRRCSIF